MQNNPVTMLSLCLQHMLTNLAVVPSCTGANPRLDDNLGRSALLEACYHGHDHIIDTLKSAGASLAPSFNSSSRLNISGSSSSNITGVRAPSSSSSDRGAKPTRDLAAAGSFGSLSVPGGAGEAGGVMRQEGSGVDETYFGASWVLQLASLLCNCVYECNLPVRREGIQCGTRCSGVTSSAVLPCPPLCCCCLLICNCVARLLCGPAR
jgi:hypothetical protein